MDTGHLCQYMSRLNMTAINTKNISGRYIDVCTLVVMYHSSL